jgi:hypothetical protein
MDAALAIASYNNMVPESDLHNRMDAQMLPGDAQQSDQFAGLLEAVTTAADQEAAQLHNEYGSAGDGSGRPKRSTRKLRGVEEQVNNTISSRPKRAQAQDASSKGESASQTENSRKRKRSLEAQEQQSNHPSEHTEREDERDSEDQSTFELRQQPPQVTMSDARAVGVHSAAALFRRPSTTSKKYTRPPMSKLFSSLEVSPENFLHLQAAAKKYMLDTNYPDRQDCVGSRGKGDTDMVKLRLHKCVRDFLDAKGNGEKYFGSNVIQEGIDPKKRKLVWPAQQSKIITAITPLLRRMITNERQRQYANESRKSVGGASEGMKARKDGEMQTPDREGSGDGSAQNPYNGFDHGHVESNDIGLWRKGAEEQFLALRDASGISEEGWILLVAKAQDFVSQTPDPGSNDQLDRFFREVVVGDLGVLERPGFWTRDIGDDKDSA